MVRPFLLSGLAGTILMTAVGCNCQRCLRRPLNDRAPSSPPPGRYLGDPVAPPPGAYIPPPPGGLPAPGTDGAYPPPEIPSNPSRSNRFAPTYPPQEILIPDSPAAKAGGVGPEIAGSARMLGDPVRAAGYTDPAKKTAPGTGLPGFALVKDGLATGRKPTLDGWDALKSAGYKTAVYLHDPATDTSAVREQAEKRGLTFVPVATSPETFDGAMSRFQSLTADKPARPIYVFDDDGVRTGSAWYTYLRTVDFLGGDEARVKAAAFGLKDPPTADQQSFWVAVQKYLSK